MTKLELLTRLSDLVDVLSSQVRDLDHSPQQYAMEALVVRFDALIDAVLTLETEDLEADDDAPCLWCGEARCTAPLSAST